MNPLLTLKDLQDERTTLTLEDSKAIVSALEVGKVIYLPNLGFKLSEKETISLGTAEAVSDSHHKNISFNTLTNQLGGVSKASRELSPFFQALMLRYAQFAYKLVTNYFPAYKSNLLWGRTSYRPTEIKNRITSKRKDDTRLHVDSFPSTPVNGKRILRVFSNINPYNEARSWHLGEEFDSVLSRFANHLPDYVLFHAHLIKWLKVTKTLRSPYDHYQLQLHDAMKLDDAYQDSVNKYAVDFPAHSTWLVFTDKVSHAALKGRHVLEQTFYLPSHAMADPSLSPLFYWEKIKPKFFKDRCKAI